MRTDPTDNGGLFVGRRPGTAPVRYNAPPVPSSERRRRTDAVLAGLLLALMSLVNLCFWGPIPAAWLWIGSQVNWRTDSLIAGLGVAFVGMIATLMFGLMVLRRLDELWILVRRAAGHDQRTGVIGRVFAICAVVGVAIFTFWFLVLVGPGSTFGPT
jgi:hypothetical protein